MDSLGDSSGPRSGRSSRLRSPTSVGRLAAIAERGEEYLHRLLLVCGVLMFLNGVTIAFVFSALPLALAPSAMVAIVTTITGIAYLSVRYTNPASQLAGVVADAVSTDRGRGGRGRRTRSTRNRRNGL